MKILLLPLFRFPTGHTKAAEAIEDAILRVYPSATVDMVDLLSYTNPVLEKGVGSFYIKWIQSSPKTYQFMYGKLVNRKTTKEKNDELPVISKVFQKKMKQLVTKHAPDIIVCTHAFPSSILGILKREGHFSNLPVINAYTDFFMNDVWAKQTSEFHFVPHQEAKQKLITNYHHSADHVFVTGIPVHAGITKVKAAPSQPNVLLAGGNIGFLDVDDLIELTNRMPATTFTVLCGNNKKLFAKVAGANNQRLIARGYISERAEMNALYENTSAIVTKPGGVTMAEVMRKRIPIFIDHFLPGPEEENFHYLNARGIVRKLNEQSLGELTDDTIINEMARNIINYEQEIDFTLEQALSAVFESIAIHE